MMSVVVVTGANRGLGLAHAKRFAERGFDVISTARDPDSATALQALASAHDNLTVRRYDARDPAGANALKAEIGETPVDILFNNAGVMGPPSAEQVFDAVAVDEILDTVRVDALAPLELSRVLADNVAASTKKLIANQSSLMGSIADNGSGGFYAYRTAKAALNMIGRSMARDLAPRGITVLTLHPGWVKTDMGGPSGTITPETCAEGQQALFDRASASDSGRFLNYDGRELPW